MSFTQINKIIQRLDRVVTKSTNSKSESNSQDIIKELGRSAEDLMKLKYLAKKNTNLPFISQSLNAVERAGLKRGEISVDPEIFSSILSIVISDMVAYIKPLQVLINTNLSNTNIDLAVNSVWEEFSSQTLSSMPTLFVPGMPQRFRKNYTRSELFVNDFVKFLCLSSDSTQRLYASESFTKWWKKWHLPAYFAIRQRYIIESISQALIIPPEIKSINYINVINTPFVAQMVETFTSNYDKM
ncbi:Conserved oligomeric Golgi complex subunit 2 [Smittium culicis]|uniref:Conserved oligomeric Golgi complex subunit 2 n=1 Tax=Smittium culicis TaxID=133412 RepID=A0A1R1Y425_9FUNG|nr:Conserved oligomeric Golgi complex subunit 2 [Smittium culicis]